MQKKKRQENSPHLVTYGIFMNKPIEGIVFSIPNIKHAKEDEIVPSILRFPNKLSICKKKFAVLEFKSLILECIVSLY